MSETLVAPTIIGTAAKRLEEHLRALGVAPAFEPCEEKLHPGSLTGRHQMYVPGDSEPRDLTESDIEVLAKRIAKQSKAPIFYRLRLPEGVDFAAAIETRSVHCRYIRYYNIQWDKKGDRLDVLFDE